MSSIIEPSQVSDCEIIGAMEPGFDEILTPEALSFVADLSRRFQPKIEALLATHLNAR